MEIHIVFTAQSDHWLVKDQRSSYDRSLRLARESNAGLLLQRKLEVDQKAKNRPLTDTSTAAIVFNPSLE